MAMNQSIREITFDVDKLGLLWSMWLCWMFDLPCPWTFAIVLVFSTHLEKRKFFRLDFFSYVLKGFLLFKPGD